MELKKQRERKEEKKEKRKKTQTQNSPAYKPPLPLLIQNTRNIHSIRIHLGHSSQLPIDLFYSFQISLQLSQ